MNAKKLFALACAALILAGLWGCGTGTQMQEQAPTAPSQNVPQVQQNETPAADTEETTPDPYVAMLMSERYHASAGEDSSYDYIVYKSSRDDSGYVIIKAYTGSDTAVTVPDTLGGFPVVGMYHSIFDGTPAVAQVTFPDSLRTVIFNTRADTDQCMAGTAWYQQQPDGVYYAGNVAIGCKGSGPFTLKEGTVGIGGAAFRGRKDLTAITFPASLLMISDDAFAGSGLTEITIPATLQYYFGAFGNCNRLEKVVFEEGITEITGTVSGSAVKEVVLPESLVTIGKKAFMNCQELRSITLPAGVRTIGESAFYGSGLTEITLNEGLEYIEQEAFQHCKQLTSIRLPASIREVGIRAVGFNLDDKAVPGFIVYFAAENANIMDYLQSNGIACQLEG